MNQDLLTVGLAQVAPVWLNREATLAKVIDMIKEAKTHAVDLLAFGEALVPGYPFWPELTNGARFNAPDQKALYALYVDQAVDIDAGHLDDVCLAAKEGSVALYLGVIEKSLERGQSLYCSMVYIDKAGQIGSVHRKLMPTYEERLNWSPGDGHGLRVHSLGAFTVGGLNCWENWMPLPRAALYGQGEDLHVAIWPGGYRNTHDITRYMAKEGRSFVMSAGGLMRPEDVPADIPYYDQIMAGCGEDLLADGGSCLSGPDGEWLIEPQCGQEGLYVATIDHAKVREERQNFSPAGHYSRPDVTRLTVNRERQSTVQFVGE